MRFSRPGKAFISKINHYKKDLVVRRFTVILGTDILVKASAFILLPVYLRLMEQEEFGLYNYLLSILSTLSLVLNFGFYVSQSKLYHQYDSPEKKGTVLFNINVLLVALMGIILTIAIVFKLDYWLIGLIFKRQFNYSEYRWLILSCLCVTIFSFMLANFFYTSEKIKTVKKYNLLRVVFINVLALTALYFIKDNTVKTRLAFTYLAEFILLLLFVKYILTEFVAKLDKTIIRQSFQIGMPIMISAFFGIFINFSDKFFIEQYGTPKDLSNYYLAFAFANILSLIFSSLQNVWLPLFLKEKDLRTNVQKTQKMISKMAGIFLLLGFCLWLLFMAMLYLNIIPHKYAECRLILPLLLITQILSTATILWGNYFVYFNKTYLVSITGLFITILTLGLSFLIVPKYGMYGAIIVNMISNLTYAIIYFILINNYIKKQLSNKEAV